MDAFTLLTALITLSALISFLNARFIKLPGTIGIIVISVVLALLILVAGKSFPRISGLITQLTQEIDFTKTLLDIMLAFLLFAGALDFDYQELKQHRAPVIILSTVGVIGSTAVFAFLLFGIVRLLQIDLPLSYCFLFGALISPTDPVAVLSILNKSKIPASLKTIIGGESLFNDGVGIILFVTISEIAGEPDATFSITGTLKIFAQEVFGGVLLGLIAAFVAFRAMKRVADYHTIILVSLAMVMGISVLGSLLHFSIPLAAVTAGLVLGNTALGPKTSENLQDYFHSFWKLIDEIMNTVLFVMIGLQVVAMPFIGNYWLIGLVSILFVLIARGIAITAPAILLRRSLSINYGSVAILIWAGLRGGISVALALSLPDSPYKELILSACFLIVIFSIIVQGLTLTRVVNAMVK